MQSSWQWKANDHNQLRANNQPAKARSLFPSTEFACYVGFTLNDLEKEIHANAREATARQTFKAICKQDRPDVAIALILQAIDDWYVKGVTHGKQGK